MRDVVGSSGAPLHDAGFRLTTDGSQVTIGAGRYYVDGLLCENLGDVDYRQQPDFLDAPDLTTLLQEAGADTAIFYLEAWRRPISGIEDPGIAEVALGGADTATRVKTVWQVMALAVKPPAAADLTCNGDAPEWTELLSPRTGRLSARAEPAATTDNPCLLPPGAGYRRLENQLYRIEIHTGGTQDAATFKWSRDNGAVVTAIEAFNGQQLTVQDLGRDETLGFSNGQTVELIDDASELSGRPGPLLQIARVEEASRLVVLGAAPAAVDASRHPKLRRWDSGEVALNAGDAAGWIHLEVGSRCASSPGPTAQATTGWSRRGR